MTHTSPTRPWNELLDSLTKQGLLDAAAAARILEHLQHPRLRSGELWFVQALLACGAWIAAIFFIVCLLAAEWLDETPASLFSWGSALLIAATILRSRTRRTFPVQLALALSVMGHACLLYGAGMLFPDDNGAA